MPDMRKRGASLQEIIDTFNLEVLHRGDDFDRVSIDIRDVNRPGLQLMGFFDYFDESRLQVIGKAETAMLRKLSPEERMSRFESLFAYPIPALVISRNLEAFPECLEMAARYGRTLLRTQETTILFTSKFIEYLNRLLAPSITRHGVLLDIYGEGVFIIGDSGIGKSETAIELVKRGHRLVSDDAVDIHRIGTQLFGRAPDLIRHYMELRGIGVVNIRQLFGMGAVKDESQIDLVVEMEHWNENKFYDRLGLDGEVINILGLDLPLVTVPVMPGRNLAIIVEVAAMNNRHKKYGINAAEEFAAQIDLAAGGGK